MVATRRRAVRRSVAGGLRLAAAKSASNPISILEVHPDLRIRCHSSMRQPRA